MPEPAAPLSIDQLAERWNVGRETVRRMAVAGRFPGAFRVGRQWRVPLAAVETYEAQQLKGARE